MSASVTTPCRVCGGRHNEYFQIDGIRAIAKAISSGEDLGGVFELGEKLAKARVAIGIGESVDTMEAHRAAADVQAAQAKVAAEFNRLASRRRPCRVCELRNRLAFLIDVAARAILEEREGSPAGYEFRIIDACEELARYAGDDHPDEDATRAVLDRARDVFLAALASTSPELAP